MARSLIDICADLEQNRQAISAAVDSDKDYDRARLQSERSNLERELAQHAPQFVKNAARRTAFKDRARYRST